MRGQEMVRLQLALVDSISTKSEAQFINISSWIPPVKPSMTILFSVLWFSPICSLYLFSKTFYPFCTYKYSAAET